MNLKVLGEAGAIVMVDAVKSKIEARCGRAEVPLTPTTMSLSTALERLSNYRIKNTRASRVIFDEGLPIFEQRLNSLGDESATFVPLCLSPVAPDWEYQSGPFWSSSRFRPLMSGELM